ncbi:MAG: prepilin-type N-terminal cleavage/methylation domain-containing protein [Colwellia sp.]|nr:prepilin-type N-terminal cleavage/methylation domain-containing protein [Colwellia sp.]
MNKNQGFTLIELVIVIVILGILAATAAPKFIDLSSDARISTLEGMKGALSSGTDMIYAKAVINQKTQGEDSIVVGGVTIELHSGYPTGAWNNSMRYIVGLDSVAFSTSNSTVCDNEWCGRGNQTSISSGITTSGSVVIGKVYPRGYSFDDECGVYFINYRDGNKPVVGLETDDC